jgi:hypothetical protein
MGVRRRAAGTSAVVKGSDLGGGRVSEGVIFEASRAMFSPSGPLLGRLELPEGD